MDFASTHNLSQLTGDAHAQIEGVASTLKEGGACSAHGGVPMRTSNRRLKSNRFCDGSIRSADDLIVRLCTSPVYQSVHEPEPENLRQLELPREAGNWRCGWDSNPR